jgi:hypothetical protein
MNSGLDYHDPPSTAYFYTMLKHKIAKPDVGKSEAENDAKRDELCDFPKAKCNAMQKPGKHAIA